ncbi:MAG: DUF2933 domain-containing protein [Alsobacter sp.]
MSHHHDQIQDAQERSSFWRSPAGIGFGILLAIAAFYLLTEHQAHLFGVLPFLFLLACPLMHMFMHKGHGGHGGHGSGAAGGPNGPGVPPDPTPR